MAVHFYSDFVMQPTRLRNMRASLSIDYDWFDSCAYCLPVSLLQTRVFSSIFNIFIIRMCAQWSAFHLDAEFCGVATNWSSIWCSYIWTVIWALRRQRAERKLKTQECHKVGKEKRIANTPAKEAHFFLCVCVERIHWMHGTNVCFVLNYVMRVWCCKYYGQ